MINPTRIAELAANLRAKWLTEEASALERLAAENDILTGELKRVLATGGLVPETFDPAYVRELLEFVDRIYEPSMPVAMAAARVRASEFKRHA